LTSDRVPRVAAAVQSKKILPTGKPRITIGAIDDHGVQQIHCRLTILRANGEQQNDDLVLWKRDEDDPLSLNAKIEAVLPLGSYQLVKGDELRIVVVAEDYRGEWPSQSGQSEPLVLEVSDRNGILAGLLETDQQSAKQLDAIIERELGIGGNKR
jgi:hypothetical protein